MCHTPVSPTLFRHQDNGVIVQPQCSQTEGSSVVSLTNRSSVILKVNSVKKNGLESRLQSLVFIANYFCQLSLHKYWFIKVSKIKLHLLFSYCRPSHSVIMFGRHQNIPVESSPLGGKGHVSIDRNSC